MGSSRSRAKRPNIESDSIFIGSGAVCVHAAAAQQVDPRAFLPSGGRSKSQRFESSRGRFFEAAAARKVHGSSPPAGVFCPSGGLPRVFFQAAAARPVHSSSPPAGFCFCSGGRSKSARCKSHRGRFSKRRLLEESTVQVRPLFFPSFR